VWLSSATGDASLIDRDDHLALRLDREGDPEPFHIEETDISFVCDIAIDRVAEDGCGAADVAIGVRRKLGLRCGNGPSDRQARSGCWETLR
jgi:hypothetical protein